MLMIVLRFAHVFFGALWVGMMVMGTFFVGPAVEEVGPDGGKFMAALQRRRIMTIMPLFALITLVTGMWLFGRLAGGNMSALLATPMGLAFALGGAAALIAFVIGIAVMRPAMIRAQQLAQSGAPGTGPEIQRLRARGNLLGRLVGVLLLFALAGMAVARYL